MIELSTLVDERPELRTELEMLIRNADYSGRWTPEASSEWARRRDLVLEQYGRDQDQQPLARFMMETAISDRLYTNSDYRVAVDTADQTGESFAPLEVADLLNDLRDGLAARA